MQKFRSVCARVYVFHSSVFTRACVVCSSDSDAPLRRKRKRMRYTSRELKRLRCARAYDRREAVAKSLRERKLARRVFGMGGGVDDHLKNFMTKKMLAALAPCSNSTKDFVKDLKMQRYPYCGCIVPSNHENCGAEYSPQSPSYSPTSPSYTSCGSPIYDYCEW